ncbi:MAG TPA: CDP-alcohol phosphatidyltransferase family protein [Flavisolibacter sp.]|jgi:CDP-diacylglycerol--serine O-phosphatidyltransferase|nr:CDP-alcohol phosphatidyltransferase family protein [Flavisolibacter sp.]
MKQIPNLFTLLNLLFGCIAIVFILQTGQSIVILNEQMGTYEPFFPEKMAWGALFIFFAAAIDFFDGFVARLLKASTDKGKQLDSLSDVVSFGVAPGMILYQLLRLGYARGEGGLDVSMAYLLPAFLFTCAVAYRLAKFNVSTNQSDSFKGVPSPAAGLVVASFPLIIWFADTDPESWQTSLQIPQYLINVWLLYITIILLSYLMVCNRNFIAFKFKDYSWGNNTIKYSLLILSVILLIVLHWLAIPIIFVLYLIFSAFSKETPVTTKATDDKTLDLTV